MPRRCCWKRGREQRVETRLLKGPSYRRLDHGPEPLRAQVIRRREESPSIEQPEHVFSNQLWPGSEELLVIGRPLGKNDAKLGRERPGKLGDRNLHDGGR